jgi:hypothetical protein
LVESQDFTEPIETTEAVYQTPLDTSVCGRQTDVFDLNGNYVKTACAVFSAKSYNEACINDGMNLFIVDSTGTERELLSFATSIFGSGGGSTLYINGKKDSDGRFYTYNPLRKPLIDSIASRFSANGDGCLILSANGAFKVDSWSCKSKMYHVCEYKKTEIERREITEMPSTVIYPDRIVFPFCQKRV